MFTGISAIRLVSNPEVHTDIPTTAKVVDAIVVATLVVLGVLGQFATTADFLHMSNSTSMYLLWGAAGYAISGLGMISYALSKGLKASKYLDKNAEVIKRKFRMAVITTIVVLGLLAVSVFNYYGVIPKLNYQDWAYSALALGNGYIALALLNNPVIKPFIKFLREKFDCVGDQRLSHRHDSNISHVPGTADYDNGEGDQENSMLVASQSVSGFSGSSGVKHRVVSNPGSYYGDQVNADDDSESDYGDQVEDGDDSGSETGLPHTESVFGYRDELGQELDRELDPNSRASNFQPQAHHVIGKGQAKLSRRGKLKEASSGSESGSPQADASSHGGSRSSHGGSRSPQAEVSSHRSDSGSPQDVGIADDDK